MNANEREAATLAIAGSIAGGYLARVDRRFPANAAERAWMVAMSVEVAKEIVAYVEAHP